MHISLYEKIFIAIFNHLSFFLSSLLNKIQNLQQQLIANDFKHIVIRSVSQVKMIFYEEEKFFFPRFSYLMISLDRFQVTFSFSYLLKNFLLYFLINFIILFLSFSEIKHFYYRMCRFDIYLVRCLSNETAYQRKTRQFRYIFIHEKIASRRDEFDIISLEIYCCNLYVAGNLIPQHCYNF